MKLGFKKYTFVFLLAVFFATPLFQAHALLGAGDAVIVVANPYEDVLNGIKSGLGSAFAHFAASYLSSLLQKIEANYKIANFLYYSDALVKGQYLQNYLDKYVPNSTDQRIILTLVPQFACGKKTDISQQLKQQAQNYLGFNPQTLSTSDPNYYFKLNRMGDFLSSPVGWQVYYQDLASQAEAQSQAAAQSEINSPGLKAPRDTANSITSSVNSIIQSEASSITASLTLGTNNPESIVGKLASSLTYTFLNNFVFKGAVFKEQATCLDPTQVQPISPISNPNPVSTPGETSLLVANPNRVAPGSTVTLSWNVQSVSGADHAVLSATSEKVGLKDSRQVRVDSNSNFSLSVFDKSGNVLKVYNVSVYITGTGPRGAPAG